LPYYTIVFLKIQKTEKGCNYPNSLMDKEKANHI